MSKKQGGEAREQAATIGVLLACAEPEARRLAQELAAEAGARLVVAPVPPLVAAVERALEVDPGRWSVVLVDAASATGLQAALQGHAGIAVLALGHGDGPLEQVRVDEGARALLRAVLHAAERHRWVTTLEAATRRERHLATHDALTGLPGRLHFEAELRRAMEEATPQGGQLAVLLLGLERFRHVNDRMGHAGGDEALLRVAERLTSVLRPGDLVARLAGDEFGVLLCSVRRAHDAARVARKLAESLADPIRVGERECWVTPSVGIALFPRDGAEADGLVRAAHAAAREARTRGVMEPCFFNRGMDDGHRQRMLIETRLRWALEHDELELHYQPKVETATGRITGAEALLRWTDAELGMVEPKTVIPVAEETGLICAVAEWSLRTACAQNAAWRRAGFGALRMSVNLSPRQIVADDLRELVVRALWDTGLPPDGLELEITENSLVGNEKLALERLADLKNVGVTISLDDFGTGFCSLAYLKRFPVDILKIDQSFVRDIAVDPDDAAIVRAIISIAHNLDLGVIAEGVETEEQRAFLQSRGCTEMQGFLVSPAIPADAFEEMLRKQQGMRAPGGGAAR